MRDEMEYFAPWRELGLNANSRKAQEASLLVQGFYFGFSDPKENANLPAKAAVTHSIAVTFYDIIQIL